MSTLALRQKVCKNANFVNPQGQGKGKLIFLLHIFRSARHCVMKSLDPGIHNLGLWRAWSSQLNILHQNPALLLTGRSGAERDSYHILWVSKLPTNRQLPGLLNEIWEKGSEILDSCFWGRWGRECIHLPRLQSVPKMCFPCLERMALWRKPFMALKSMSSELSWG